MFGSSTNYCNGPSELWPKVQIIWNWKIFEKNLVEDLSNVSGVDLSKGGDFKEFQQFQK